MLWLYSGLADEHQKECDEQHRVHALLSIPNPLKVLVNMLRSSFFGDHLGISITRFLSGQNYIVQICLIFFASVVIGLIAKSILFKIPALFTYILQIPDRYIEERYQDIQLNLAKQRAPPEEKALVQKKVDERTLRRRNENLQKFQQWVVEQQRTNATEV